MPVAFLITGYYRHPKMLAAGEAAETLWARALDYAAEHGTEGFIPTNAPLQICPTKTKARVAALVRERLWDVVEGGWQIHDYLEWNRNQAEQAARKEAVSRARSAAGKKGMATRWGSRITRETDNKPDNSTHNKRGNKAVSPDNPGPGPGPKDLGFSSRDPLTFRTARETTRESTPKTQDPPLISLCGQCDHGFRNAPDGLTLCPDCAQLVYEQPTHATGETA